MYLSPETLTILICLDIILLGFLITIDLAFYSLKSLGKHDPDRSPYLDDDGNHSYYERSLIEKSSYLRSHPSSRLRSIRTLLGQFFHH